MNIPFFSLEPSERGSYGGWVGTVGARYTEDGKLSASPSLEEAEHRLAMVAGTSTCHLVLVRSFRLSIDFGTHDQ